MWSKRTLIILGAFVCLLILPYAIAWISGGNRSEFNGFLLNPIDGYSYLAKMRMGYEGGWMFHLPFTYEVGKGSFLFLYYLALGHLARITSLPLLLIFHIARIVNALFMALMIGLLSQKLFTGSRRALFLGFMLFSGGMGWVLLSTGILPPDLWIAEMYPFLSGYANPHFPLVIGCMVAFLLLSEGKTNWIRWLILAVISLVIGIVLPFGSVILASALFVSNLLHPQRYSVRTWIPWMIIVGINVPILVYDLLAIFGDPLLLEWNKQNVTPSPPVIAFLFSLFPALILALITILRGGWYKNSLQTMLVCWVGLSIIASLSPIPLQRRFLIGLFVPTAALAGLTIEHWTVKNQRMFRYLVPIFFILSIPTNIFQLTIAWHGIREHSDLLYLTHCESQAMAWLDVPMALDKLVIASPETGLFLPARSHVKVIYGHPFETPFADKNKQKVIELLRSPGEFPDRLQIAGIAKVYYFWGPREKLETGIYELPLKTAFSCEDTAIYELE